MIGFTPHLFLKPSDLEEEGNNNEELVCEGTRQEVRRINTVDCIRSSEKSYRIQKYTANESEYWQRISFSQRSQ